MVTGEATNLILHEGDVKAIALITHFPIRPMRGTWRKAQSGYWEIEYPTEDIRLAYPTACVRILGGWDDQSGVDNMTWRQLTNHIAGEVLRQNVIAAKLRSLGFDRFNDEPYVSNNYNMQKYLLTLHPDELETLLDKVLSGVSNEE